MFVVFPLTVSGNGQEINGMLEDMIVDSANSYGELTYSGVANGWILTSASVGSPVVTKPLLHVQERQNQGTSAGNTIIGTQTRVLNTIIQNDISGASIGSNQITLPAGTYDIDLRIPVVNITSLCSYKARLYNVTNSTYLLEGEGATLSIGGNQSATTLRLFGVLTFSTTTVLEIREYTSAVITNGLGYPISQGAEVYTDVRIWRLDANKTLVVGPQFSSADIGKSLIVGGTHSQVYQNLQGRRNYIINGNFDIWQRGITQSVTGYGSDDRWTNDNNGTTKVVSQQVFPLGQTEVPGNPKYFSRTIVTSVANTANYCVKSQRIEFVNTLAGRIATLSFWAKADANKNICIEIFQSFGTGGSPSGSQTALIRQVSLTTVWTKYTISFTVPSLSGKTIGTANNDYLQIGFWFDSGATYSSRSLSLGQQSGTFDIAQVQLEDGSVSTEFERRTVGDEMLLCQRFYELGNDHGILVTAAIGSYGGGIVDATFKVTKRALPTTVSVTKTSGTIAGLNGTANKNRIQVTPSAQAAANTYAVFDWSVDAEL